MGLTDGMGIGYTADVREELDLNISGGDATPIELNLSSEWDEQSKDLARRFAEKLGLSREDYIEEIKKIVPEFGPKPESFNLEIPAIPILVDPRVPWSDLLASDVDIAKSHQAELQARRQARLGRSESPQPEQDFENLRINPMFDLQELKDWEEGGFQTPNEPYATWLTYCPNKSVKEVRAVLRRSKNIRGGTVFDVIYLYYKRPQILNTFNINLPGSQIGSDYSPFLSALRNAEAPNPKIESRPNHPSLNEGSIDTKHPMHASLIASKV